VNKIITVCSKIWANISALTLLGWLISAVVGAIISHFVEAYLSRSKKEADMAQYYVANMPIHCHPKASMELDEQVKRFIEASRRAKAGGRGIPVWRNDCSMGENFSITLEENMRFKETLDTLTQAK
jgi:hypothetical protein